MTLPTNSVSVQGIGTTSPAVESGKTSVVRLSDEIKEWMAATSPSGATAYDTGWVDIAPASGFSSTRAAVRRIGKEIKYRGYINGTISSGATIGTVPTGFRPTAVDDTLDNTVTGQSAIIRAQVIPASGAIVVYPPASILTNVYLKGLSGYLVD